MHFVTSAAMFSKVLLLLAVCFQVLRTGNSMDYLRQMRCPWQIGESVNLHIRKHRGQAAAECKVWLQDEKGDSGDSVLVSVLSEESFVDGSVSSSLVINTYVDGKWQKEDRTDISAAFYPLIEDIMAEEKGFKIKIQDNEYFREYGFKLENIKYIKVECPYENVFIVRDTWSKN